MKRSGGRAETAAKRADDGDVDHEGARLEIGDIAAGLKQPLLGGEHVAIRGQPAGIAMPRQRSPARG